MCRMIKLLPSGLLTPRSNVANCGVEKQTARPESQSGGTC